MKRAAQIIQRALWPSDSSVKKCGVRTSHSAWGLSIRDSTRLSSKGNPLIELTILLILRVSLPNYRSDESTGFEKSLENLGRSRSAEKHVRIL